MKKIYVCNDTITGIFSAIYDAWKEGREEKECGIAIKGMLEQELFCEYILVEENLHKEQAVERLIRKHLGGQAYADIWHASLASDKDKADAIYGTMLAARRLRDSKKVMEHNEFKDQLYEVLDENDVALGIEDIDTSDAANIFTIKTRDGSVFEIETRKIE